MQSQGFKFKFSRASPADMRIGSSGLPKSPSVCQIRFFGCCQHQDTSWTSTDYPVVPDVVERPHSDDKLRDLVDASDASGQVRWNASHAVVPGSVIIFITPYHAHHSRTYLSSNTRKHNPC
ncbi:unnamed protein product [Symbiodinium sp. CCMP2592]|nr:unnamed protein product [Symbiodinium sp. CCMP2592]